MWNSEAWICSSHLEVRASVSVTLYQSVIDHWGMEDVTALFRQIAMQAVLLKRGQWCGLTLREAGCSYPVKEI